MTSKARDLADAGNYDLADFGDFDFPASDGSSGQVLQTDGSGNLSFDFPSSNIPVFSAYMASSQTTTSATWTKANFNTERFDSDGLFDTTTNRFTPDVAGYYFITVRILVASGVGRAVGAAAYKNGGAVESLNIYMPGDADLDDGSVQVSALIYLNGSSDYIEPYGLQAAYSGLAGNSTYTTFSGYLVRAD